MNILRILHAIYVTRSYPPPLGAICVWYVCDIIPQLQYGDEIDVPTYSACLICLGLNDLPLFADKGGEEQVRQTPRKEIIRADCIESLKRQRYSTRKY